VFGVMGVTTVTAQETQNNATTAQNVERDLGDGLVVRDITYDFENETISVVMFSENEETVTFTDALITEDRTEPLNRETYTIEGETVVTFNVQSYNSRMAITIDANGQLHPFLKSDSLFDFTQNYTARQLIVSVIFGGMLGTGTVLVVAYKRKIKTSSEIQKVT
jgi:hypothetical protein